MEAVGEIENCQESRPEDRNNDIEVQNRAEFSQTRQDEEEERWRTETHDSFPKPRPELPRTLGRRRELVKTFIGIRVFGETIKAMTADPPSHPPEPSEYAENYCDSSFTPFMDRTDYDARKHLRYPLYGGGIAQSYYKSQLDKGALKVRSEIPNFNDPFRRSCSFTTPPDLALREPTGGF